MSALTKTERRIFAALVNGNTRTGDLAVAVYGYDDPWARQAIRVHIHNIRRKLPGRIASSNRGPLSSYRLVA